MLTLAGLGLGGPEDLTLRGLAAVRAADALFVESYTTPLAAETLDWLARETDRPIHRCTRTEVEEPTALLEAARDGDAVLLVGGDPLGATTHSALRQMCREQGIACRVVHNASVLTAVAGALGLQHYRFGPVATLVLPQGEYRPLSPVDKVRRNLADGYHSLVLLDIRADDPAAAPRCMTATEGLAQLLAGGIAPDTPACVAARVGHDDEALAAGHLAELAQREYGAPPHALAVPGKLHFAEREALTALGLEA